MTDGPRTDGEQKVDELNEALLEAYAAGFSAAAETFDVDAPFDCDVDSLTNNIGIQEKHFYYWDGRETALHHWLAQEEYKDA